MGALLQRLGPPAAAAATHAGAPAHRELDVLTIKMPVPGAAGGQGQGHAEGPSDAHLSAQLQRAYRRRQLDLFRKALAHGADPDSRCPDSGAPLLGRACAEPCRDEYVRALLRAGADPNRGSPALAAARAENFASLEMLMLQPGFDVNATFADGGSILHVLFRMPCKMRNTEKLLRCIGRALDRLDVQVNRPDSFGMTPIMYAVELYQEDRVHAMLKQSRHKLNLDVLQPALGKTIREFILKRFFDLKDFLPPEAIEDLSSPDPHVRLLAALQHRRLDVFQDILRARDADGRALVNPDYWHDDPYYCTCLELACRINGCEQFVQALLDAGADPTAVSKMDGTPLIHFVLDCCNYATLKVLLQDGRLDVCKPSYMDVSALHLAAVQKSDNPEANERGLRCVELLLSSHCQARGVGPAAACIDVNCRDGNGDTPLHYAAQHGCREVVLALLRRGACLMVRNNSRQPPMHFLAAQVLEEFLDDQVDSNDYSSRTGCYTLIFKFGFLHASELSGGGGGGPSAEMEPLLCLTAPHLRRLLQHPVISSYLYLKWTRVRVFFYLNVAFYTVFVLALTAFILLNESPMRRFPLSAAHDDNSSVPDTEAPANASHPVRDTFSSFFEDDRKHAMKAWMLVVIFFFGYVINEIFQVFMLRLQYFQITSNYMSLLVISVTGVVITHHWIDDSVYKHLCAIAILISWLDLVLISGRLPTWSIQLEMLKKVTSTFLTFMTWYFLLIVAFALCFHTLFFKFKMDESLDNKEDNFFVDPFLSVVKTIAMFAGEFGISALPFWSVPGTSHVVFVVFVFLIAIVLLNLLNGLAVYDTQAIKENARVLSLVSLVRLVASIERTLLDLRASLQRTGPSLARCLPDPRLYQEGVCFHRKQIQVFPNERGKIKFYMDMDATNRFRKFRMSDTIVKSATDILTRRRKRSDMEQIRAMFGQVDERLRGVEAREQRVAGMLEQLAQGLTQLTQLVRLGPPPPPPPTAPQSDPAGHASRC